MNAELIAIGSELVCGAHLDTNSQWLSRELEARGEQTLAALNQARDDHTRTETERDALRARVQAQADELAAVRAEREQTVTELAKLAARLEAQQTLLTDYRTQLGVAGPAA